MGVLGFGVLSSELECILGRMLMNRLLGCFDELVNGISGFLTSNRELISTRCLGFLSFSFFFFFFRDGSSGFLRLFEMGFSGFRCSDSAEDSNSSSGVTTELEVYPKHKLNLELSIGLPCQPQPSSINDLNDSKQANQRHQEHVVIHQSFRTSATPFSSAPAVVHRTACLCTYNRGFKKSVTADSQYRFYRPLDA
ncbi:hypothetical protein DKX38_028800 [Salix brachista]|uniref:Uncharacterized protein n=1 Tax=Salix brachista TaxID=2182728 RepID=A0A5N5IZ40_9ROSI|nr:hypothetical protein DKX38_028800 [Salix brachista]